MHDFVEEMINASEGGEDLRERLLGLVVFKHRAPLVYARTALIVELWLHGVKAPLVGQLRQRVCVWRYRHIEERGGAAVAVVPRLIQAVSARNRLERGGGVALDRACRAPLEHRSLELTHHAVRLVVEHVNLDRQTFANDRL